jgi:hypothetical protein
MKPTSHLDKYILDTPEGPLRIVDGKGLALGQVASVSAKRCAAGNRGERVRVQGDGATTKDAEYVCVNDAGTYAWKEITRAGGAVVALADGGTGASLTDPNADRIPFWDDSAGAVTWLAPNTGLAISTTNLNLNAVIDDLTDVTITSVATGDLLRYSGSAWVNVKPTVLLVAFVTREDPTTAAANWVWTNMPLAATILYGASTHSYSRRMDLTYANQVRLSIDVATGGVSGAKLYLRYSTDNSSFTDMTSASCTFGTGTGVFTSGWVNLDSGAKADVWVQVWGSGGDGAADPRFFTISAEFR